MSLRIVKTGLLAQFQDLGRQHCRHLGLSQSGAMDRLAFQINNALLRQDLNLAQIEIAYGGAEFITESDCQIALSGCNTFASINGQSIVNFASHFLQAGDQLQLHHPKHGVFCYLAIAGGFVAPQFYDSCSSTLRLGIGQALQTKQIVSAQTVSRQTVSVQGSAEQLATGQSLQRCLPQAYQPLYGGCLAHNGVVDLDVLPAYQHAAFTSVMRDRFVTQTYKLQSADRMGARLQAEMPISYDCGEMISEAITVGAIQITNNGQPIILGCDAQSVGGYPKIGVLPDYALGQLAQQSAGSRIRFCWIDVDGARQKQQQQARLIASLQGV